jgi:3-oxoacyl-[acyl-carrier protein] reductase
MENKVALITGGAKGIGRSIAIALAKENWEIVICYRNSKNEADKLASEIKIKTVQ